MRQFVPDSLHDPQLFRSGEMRNFNGVLYNMVIKFFLFEKPRHRAVLSAKATSFGTGLNTHNVQISSENIFIVKA